MKVRSLLIFTLLSQIAVGIFISNTILQISYMFQPETIKENGSAIYILSIFLLIISFLLVSISLLFSLTHLGSPRRAWRAIWNLRHSWLSREIVFGLLFVGFEGLVILAYLFPSILTISLFSSLVSGMLCGLTFIYSMAHVYMQRTIPNWNSNQTLLTFYLTAGSSGLLASALGLSVVPGVNDPWVRSAIIILSRSAALVIALQIINQSLVHLRVLPANPLHPGQRKISIISDRLMIWNLLSFLLAAVTASLPVWLPEYSWLLLLLALSLVLLGEITTRIAFYTSYNRSGL